jgi:glutamate-1-semialdehyde 2,1-aminomutase
MMLDFFRREVFLNPVGTKLYLSVAHDDAICDEFLGHFEGTLAAVSSKAMT